MKNKKIIIGIIGFGVIGQKRANAIQESKHGKIRAICDTNNIDFKKFNFKDKNIYFTKLWNDIIIDTEINTVIISANNILNKKILFHALKNKKNCIIEKPIIISNNYFKKLEMLSRNKLVIEVGYNLKYFDSILKVKKILSNKSFGRIIDIDIEYSNGSRLNFHKEWRANKMLSGGGVSIDLGVHCLDIVSFLCNNLKFKQLKYIKGQNVITKDVEDILYLNLLLEKDILVNIKSSWRRWKNIFKLNIVGQKKMLSLNGLTGSYGHPNLIVYSRKLFKGKPKEDIIKCEDDNSFLNQWKSFVSKINKNNFKNNQLKESFLISEVIRKVYK